MKPYKQLSRSSIRAALMQLATTEQDWISYHEFDTLIVPHWVLAEESAFDRLPPFIAGILRMEPNTCYDWHVDGKRKGSINMLLNPADSLCLFRKSEGHYFQFEKLDYIPGYYYAFDTQVPHTVINNRNTRYLFSIEFVEPLDYGDLLQIVSSTV